MPEKYISRRDAEIAEFFDFEQIPRKIACTPRNEMTKESASLSALTRRWKPIAQLNAGSG